MIRALRTPRWNTHVPGHEVVDPEAPAKMDVSMTTTDYDRKSRARQPRVLKRVEVGSSVGQPNVETNPRSKKELASRSFAGSGPIEKLQGGEREDQENECHPRAAWPVVRGNLLRSLTAAKGPSVRSRGFSKTTRSGLPPKPMTCTSQFHMS